MSSFDNDTHNAAVDAFSSGLPADEWSVPEENQPNEGVTQGESQEQVQSPPETQEPVSRDIDLSHLPPEAQEFIRARERELTADYTRKTQEVAQQRREAEQALQFIEALNSDQNFARQVYETLGQVLTPQEEAALYGQEPWNQSDLDPYSLDESEDPYHKELQELKAWKESFETQLEQARLEADLNNQLATIRSQNPHFTDEDVQDILALGFTTNADLNKAAEMFKATEQRLMSRWVEQKGNVNTPAPISGGSGQTFVPDALKDVKDLDDPRLRAAAMERLRNELG